MTLIGIVTDWSDAEINGLKLAVGEEMATKLLKGCGVHWQCSCQRVADRVASSAHKQMERNVFLKIAYKIPALKDGINAIACFETLCGVRTVKQLLEKLPLICSNDEAELIDKKCNWSVAKHWAQWWSRCDHLRMLSRAFTLMDQDIWTACPSTTNAVERRNKDCKSAEIDVSLSYRSTTEEARQEAEAENELSS